ncbi:MAG TPA: hypothetical protein VGT41_00365 [Candidatus Babeliales bacterium]|nr:hypothetical protein [Candidatus Babeliales bacterium]
MTFFTHALLSFIFVIAPQYIKATMPQSATVVLDFSAYTIMQPELYTYQLFLPPNTMAPQRAKNIKLLHPKKIFIPTVLFDSHPTMVYPAFLVRYRKNESSKKPVSSIEIPLTAQMRALSIHLCKPNKK